MVFEEHRPVGRPTKYSMDMVEKAIAYFADPSINGDLLATRAGLAVYLGISKPTILEWEKAHPAFSVAIKEGMAHQEIQLTNHLMDKEKFTAGSIFVAKNILGWKDKQEINAEIRDVSGFEILEDED